LAAIVLVGLAVRLIAAWRLSPHIDEPASVLAIRMTAERGAPIFPSGVLYLQGATLSYVLAPLARVADLGLDTLATLRLASVAAGTVAIALTYRLGRMLAGPGAGLLAAALVALDPPSVQWSAHVRMYAPLQALTLVVACLFVAEIGAGGKRAPGDGRRLVWLTLAFWAAVFTHVGAALLWPPMALAALLIHGRALGRRRRGLAIALGLCLLAPVALAALNGLGEAGAATRGDGSGDRPGFVGDHVLDSRRVLDPHLSAWTALFAQGAGAGLVPTLVVVLSGIVAGYWLLDVPSLGARGRSVGAVLGLAWVPVLLVALLTFDVQARYVLHVQAIGLALAAAGLALVAGAGRRAGAGVGRARWPAVGAGAVALLLLVHAATGTWSRLASPTVDPDYVAALRYVAAERDPGELVAVALPPTAYLVLGGSAGLRFLAGPEDEPRVARYTLPAADGTARDYWAGAESIVSTAALCDLLAGNRDAWVVVDAQRLGAGWAYAGPFGQVLSGATKVVYRAPGDAQVHRALPKTRWSPRASLRCAAA